MLTDGLEARQVSKGISGVTQRSDQCVRTSQIASKREPASLRSDGPCIVQIQAVANICAT